MINDKKKNPKALMALGITFLGSGVALSTAVNPGVGMGLITLGIVFLAMGMKQKKDQNKNNLDNISSGENS